MPDGVWKPASDALQIGKHAIPTFAAQPIKRIGKEGIISLRAEFYDKS
jgi:hypothetical protein